jgi:hypothetical protein
MPVPPPMPTPSAGQSWKPAPTIATTSPWPVVPQAPAKSEQAVRPAATAPADKLGEAYVTTGVVFMEDSPGTAVPAKMLAPTPMATARLVPAAVKTSIEKLCGPNIHNVLVRQDAGSKVAINFSASNEADGKLFFDRIQTMPELSNYVVDVTVSINK